MSTGNFEKKTANTLPSLNNKPTANNDSLSIKPTIAPINTVSLESLPPEVLKQIIPTGQGPELWNFFNALAFIILMICGFALVFWGLAKITAISEVKKNWKMYRCDPTIMPFASFYGYNTVDNFNYCMGSIFTEHSSDITSSFSSVLGSFTGILSVLMESVNSIRTSVATLGGGINVIFQDFTDRISTFFFQIRMSAIRIKMLMQRMYATMFAVMYMGMSSLTAGVNFSNTILFSFLDTFCFEPTTEIVVKGKGSIPISDIQIGDILMPTESRVTAKFHFHAHGQPMVKFQNGIHVSSNHYILHNKNWIRSEYHPDAVCTGEYTGGSLLCLNTHDHQIPVKDYIFRDYDETEENDVDAKTMKFIEHRINGLIPTLSNDKPYIFKEYTPAVNPDTQVKCADGSIQPISDIQLHTKLSTGSTIIGKVQREIQEYCCIISSNIILSPSTLIWDRVLNKWRRAGELYPIQLLEDKKVVCVSLFVTPSSIIELSDGTVIRDSIELCSPDAEMYYADQLKHLNT
jgi:hypothetical protein